MAAVDIPKLLNVNEAAERLGVSKSFLDKLRSTGEGPTFFKLGARVAYAPADLSLWLDANRHASTAGRRAAVPASPSSGVLAKGRRCA